MNFRETNQKLLIPIAQTLMIFGIFALCQPWVEVLHRYGLTIILIGLVAFMITTKVPAPAPRDDQ